MMAGMSLKTDVAEKALDILTDPTKILKAVLWLGDRNNAKARAEFLETMEDQNVTNAQRLDANDQRLDEMDRLIERVVGMVVRPEQWKGRERDMPTRGDVIARAEQFTRGAEGAGSHGKRRILWNAFHSSFKPEFYREGWSNHLWNIAEQVEYPECRWLAEHSENKEKKSAPVIESGAEAHFLVERLASLGLVRNVVINEQLQRIQSYATDVGRRFKQFVWDEEMWRDEKPAG